MHLSDHSQTGPMPTESKKTSARRERTCWPCILTRGRAEAKAMGHIRVGVAFSIIGVAASTTCARWICAPRQKHSYSLPSQVSPVGTQILISDIRDIHPTRLRGTRSYAAGRFIGFSAERQIVVCSVVDRPNSPDPITYTRHYRLRALLPVRMGVA